MLIMTSMTMQMYDRVMKPGSFYALKTSNTPTPPTIAAVVSRCCTQPHLCCSYLSLPGTRKVNNHRNIGLQEHHPGLSSSAKQ
jgi:hypothetical protein